MTQMASPYRHPTTGVYYIRRKVPKDLQGLIPEIYKRTLRTKDLPQAKVRFAQAWIDSEKHFEEARERLRRTEAPPEVPERDIQQMAARWFRKTLDEMERTGDFTPLLVPAGTAEETPETLRSHLRGNEVPEGWLESVIVEETGKVGLPGLDPMAPLYRRLYRAFSEHLLRLSELAQKRHEGDWVTEAPLLKDSPLSFEKELKGKTLMTVFELYLADRKRGEGDTRSYQRSANTYRSNLDGFVELYGDLPVSAIDRQKVQEYRQDLLQLPNKAPGLRGLSIRERIALAASEDLPLLAMKTVKVKLMMLSAVLGYAVEMGLLQENPVTASGASKRLDKAATKRAKVAPKDYSMEELVKIFQGPAHTESWRSPRADLGEALYWVPLLAAYTGARREELCQLYVSDVKTHKEGIHYLSILEADDDKGRTVKTQGSRRFVPLHLDLIELGFLRYLEGLPKNGQLFPGLPADSGGWYGIKFGLHWERYLRDRVSLQSSAKPAHGFRHSFKTLCRAVGIPEDVHDALTGHADGSVSRDYGQMPISRLAEELKKFPSIAKEAGLLK